MSCYSAFNRFVEKSFYVGSGKFQHNCPWEATESRAFKSKYCDVVLDIYDSTYLLKDRGFSLKKIEFSNIECSFCGLHNNLATILHVHEKKSQTQKLLNPRFLSLVMNS